MKTYGYALLFLLSFYYKVIDDVGATGISYHSRNINFNQQHEQGNSHPNTIHNLTLYQQRSQPGLEFYRDTYRFSNRQQNNDWNRNPVENSQRLNNTYTNNEQGINRSRLDTDKQIQYIGLSLIHNTGHNHTTNPHTTEVHKPTYSLNSDISPESISMNIFTKEEHDCFNSDLVYFNHTCHELFQRGPCANGEWLIVDLKSALQEEPRIVPKCERNACRNNKIYWPSTQRCYELSEKTDKELCLPGNTWQADYFSGNGICRCIRSPTIHGLFNNGTCYPLYTQGACLKNHIFVEKNHTTECIKNPCKNSSLTVFEDYDKKCYELNSKGPCDKDQHFIISSITLKPTCSKSVQSLMIINPPELCSTNGNKVCQPEFKVDQGAEYIKKILLAAHKKKVKSLRKLS